MRLECLLELVEDCLVDSLGEQILRRELKSGAAVLRATILRRVRRTRRLSTRVTMVIVAMVVVVLFTGAMVLVVTSVIVPSGIVFGVVVPCVGLVDATHVDSASVLVVGALVVMTVVVMTVVVMTLVRWQLGRVPFRHSGLQFVLRARPVPFVAFSHVLVANGDDSVGSRATTAGSRSPEATSDRRVSNGSGRM